MLSPVPGFIGGLHEGLKLKLNADKAEALAVSGGPQFWELVSLFWTEVALPIREQVCALGELTFNTGAPSAWLGTFFTASFGVLSTFVSRL